MSFTPTYSSDPSANWTSSPPSIGYTQYISDSVSNEYDNVGNASLPNSLDIGVWHITANAFFQNAPNCNILVTFIGSGGSGGINQTYEDTFYTDGGTGGGGANYYSGSSSGPKITITDNVLCSATNFSSAGGQCNSLSASGILIVNANNSVTIELWMYSETTGTYSGSNNIFTSYSLSATRIG